MDERDLIWLGSSLKDLKSFSEDVQNRIGYQIERVQSYREPHDWRSMKDVGRGVREIRVSSKGRAYRSIYVVVKNDIVYVLHVFEKKTQKTSKRDRDLARNRLRKIGA